VTGQGADRLSNLQVPDVSLQRIHILLVPESSLVVEVRVPGEEMRAVMLHPATGLLGRQALLLHFHPSFGSNHLTVNEWFRTMTLHKLTSLTDFLLQ
jgi:hypothetical protein